MGFFWVCFPIFSNYKPWGSILVGYKNGMIRPTILSSTYFTILVCLNITYACLDQISGSGLCWALSLYFLQNVSYFLPCFLQNNCSQIFSGNASFCHCLCQLTFVQVPQQCKLPVVVECSFLLLLVDIRLVEPKKQRVSNYLTIQSMYLTTFYLKIKNKYTYKS